MSSVRTFSSLFALAALCGVFALSGSPAEAAQVQIGAELGQSTIDRKAGDRVYLRLSLKTLTAKQNDGRPPINVALVIDRSGSMSGDRLAADHRGQRGAGRLAGGGLARRLDRGRGCLLCGGFGGFQGFLGCSACWTCADSSCFCSGSGRCLARRELARGKFKVDLAGFRVPGQVRLEGAARAQADELVEQVGFAGC